MITKHMQVKSRRIDRKFFNPKRITMKREVKYAMPAHIGNALWPMRFGKIPDHAAVLEKYQNLKSLGYSDDVILARLQEYLSIIKQYGVTL